ncbi:hypothetical protein EWD33_22065 [Salmonella enterica subsp. enterica serovar Oranienburg]|nr:hypothetical protein [Salmonella enterica subsp. enterica serovar Oranienburg]
MFYEGEVDIHLNPKSGADWQVREKQKRVMIHWLTKRSNRSLSVVGAGYLNIIFCRVHAVRAPSWSLFCSWPLRFTGLFT